jgi:hypothetical protein
VETLILSRIALVAGAIATVVVFFARRRQATQRATAERASDRD